MKKAWKWVAGVLGGMAVVMALVVWQAHRRADEVFNRHAADVAAKIAVLRARDPARKTIYDDALPGNGWDHYTKAFDAIAAIPDAEAEEIPAVRGDPDFVPDPAKLDALFERCAPLFEELRFSLRVKDFNPDYAYEEAARMELPYVAKAIRVSKFLSGAATHRHSQGRDREAAELLILNFGVAEDTLRGGFMINALVSVVCEGVGTYPWREILSNHSLSARDLEDAASKLETLDRERPDFFDALLTEDVFVRQNLLSLDRGIGPAEWVKVRPGLWRYLFSARIAAAQALNEYEGFFARVKEVGDRPVHERYLAMEKLEDVLTGTKNPFVAILASAVGKAYHQEAVARMNWTLMRVATAIAWYEAEKGVYPAALNDLVPKYLPTVPDCPLTGLPLRYTAGKVWSVGADRKDDGGAHDDMASEEDSTGDIVWEVKRK